MLDRHPSFICFSKLLSAFIDADVKIGLPGMFFHFSTKESKLDLNKSMGGVGNSLCLLTSPAVLKTSLRSVTHWLKEGCLFGRVRVIRCTAWNKSNLTSYHLTSQNVLYCFPEFTTIIYIHMFEQLFLGSCSISQILQKLTHLTYRCSFGELPGKHISV